MNENKRLFEEIYNETKENTYRFIAAKCYNIDDIDDIYQSTYISVYDALLKREGRIENKEAFVILIAKRELFKYYGLITKLKACFKAPLSREDEDIKEDADTFCLEDSVVNKALLEEINALIEKKDITTQKIFFLYYYKGYTLSEIADMLGIGQSNVKRRLYSVLSQIRRLYGKE